MPDKSFFAAFRRLIWRQEKDAPHCCFCLCLQTTTTGSSMMSTKTEQAVSDIDDIISTSDSDFQTTGLKGDTVIRLTRVAAVTDSLFTGTIGHVGSERLTRVKENLARWILAS